MSGYRGPSGSDRPAGRQPGPYGGDPRVDPATYPPTEQLPQQLPPPGAAGGAGAAPPTPPNRGWQIAGLGVLAVAALVFFLLAVFGVFGDDGVDTVGTVDDGQPTATARVPAIAQTVFRCPIGSMGSPTADDPNCVIAASTELVVATERVQTTYRCPAGATGSPNAARPECAATTAGAVAAVATTRYRCPQGSTGSPTADDPFCVSADQQVRVPVEQITVVECDGDADLDDTVNPAECVSTVRQRQEVPAVEDIRFDCPPDPDVDPPLDRAECRRELADDPSCPMPTRPAEDEAWICFGALVSQVASGVACPAGSRPDPERPSTTDDTACHRVDPPCERGSYEEYTDSCVRSAVAAATAEIEPVCPDDIEAADATVVDDRCEYEVDVEDRKPASARPGYRCPEGSRGQASGPDSVCVADRDVEVPALATTTYACPAGSTGSPTASAPTCTSTTTETVPAIVETETVFECPDGTVGDPTAQEPSCARTRGAQTVPASVVTEFSCPTDTVGTPTVTDPFCRPGG